MENITPPSVTEVTDNVVKTADSFDKKPMATAFGIVVFVLIGIIIFQIYTLTKKDEVIAKKDQEKEIIFQQLIRQTLFSSKQEKVITVQSEVINKTVEVIDSTKLVKLKSK